ncbi:zinc finger protein constans-like [Anaeramoeba flamelloides]|uniref:Zinc finger protein constans-like n=1 Tax=Anaeramoeba flamelloides TaxID=1746091 RepID=A0AAV7YDY4_9EUKA|nr:zinc finger protein constans-like [Anaeramoeba flamelloides]
MNNSNNSQKKKQKSQDPKRLKDIRIPVEPQIPQCEVCEEKKADFYCTKCEVHYCKACESELHTSSFLKKSHKEFVSKEPYVSRENKNTIKFLQESNEIIEKDKEEREKERKKEQQRKREIQREKESKEIHRLNHRKIRDRKNLKGKKILEEFDPKMNSPQNLIKIKNENKTAWNPSPLSEDWGRICGKKIYSRGKHQIKIKIDQFPNPENEMNYVYLGVIKTENKKNFIENGNYEGTYFFESFWDGRENASLKVKKENGKLIEENYPEEIYLKKNDIFEIFLDMDQKKISFKLNKKNLGGWEKLPEKVKFFAYLKNLEGKEKNQITII